MLKPLDLAALIDRVWPLAEEQGLCPGQIHFELVGRDGLDGLASQQGMPLRYAHWSFGKSYQRVKDANAFQRSQVYELVVNSDPAYAFIDSCGTRGQALLIIAHVLAHADFFRHNRCFREIPHDMIARMAAHRRRIAGWSGQYGSQAVESLIDAAQVLMDFTGESTRDAAGGLTADDVMGYVARRAPLLTQWERECLADLRTEARYFWPQQLTKIANEGYATFWHTRLMRKIAAGAEEAWDTARLNAQIVAVAPPALNP